MDFIPETENVLSPSTGGGYFFAEYMVDALSRVLQYDYDGSLVREVELLCGGVPWVFARTLIPARSLRGPVRRLTRLGTKPLGAVLFSDPKVERGRMQIAHLFPRHPLFSSAVARLEQVPQDIWGRRTLYYLDRRPLLVNELFLPPIPMSDR